MIRSMSAMILLCSLLLPGASAWGDGALSFDGTNDRVTVPYDDSFPTEVFSTCAWIQASPPGHRAAIIARGEDDDSWDLAWQLYLEPDGSLRLMVEDSSMQNHCYPYVCFSQNLQPNCRLSGDLFVADETWRHVAATRTASGDLVMYVDGQAVAECTNTGVPSADNFQDLTIGCTHGTIGPPPGGEEPPVWFFPGLIDEPAMWNVALSSEDVQLLHSDGVEPDSNGLVGYWTFDESKGQQVADLSPAGNHGVLGEDASAENTDPDWIVFADDCVADFDGDGTVDAADLALLLGNWGPCAGCPMDFDDDGQVGASDLAVVLGVWGPCP